MIRERLVISPNLENNNNDNPFLQVSRQIFAKMSSRVKI